MNRTLIMAGVSSALFSAVLDPKTAGAPAVVVPLTPAEQAAAVAAAAEAKKQVEIKIKAQFNNLVDIKDSKFFFKKVDIEGPDPADPTGVKKVKIGETKRPTVEIPLPVPSVEGIVSILEHGQENPKALELLMEAVAEVISNRARDILNDDEKQAITGVDNFPMDELAWDKIANLPKAERRGGGISKEIWEAFGDDYVAVMPAVTGKNAEQVGNAAKILLNKFNQVKTMKPVLKLMKDQLGLYVSSSPNAETYADCVKFLLEKVETLINFDESSLLKNL